MEIIIATQLKLINWPTLQFRPWNVTHWIVSTVIEGLEACLQGLSAGHTAHARVFTCPSLQPSPDRYHF